eukprot:CCRYP_011770-RA/>CCRYP_011770-RA protein AED:0.03 eAED:0.03 QI:204/1/1/1/1/1/2/358/209
MTANSKDDKRVVVGASNPPVTIAGVKIRIQQRLSHIPSEEETVALDATKVEVLMQWCRVMESVLLDYTLLKDLVPMTLETFPNSLASASIELLRHLQTIADCASTKVVLMSNVLYPQTTTLLKKIIRRKIVKNVGDQVVEETEDVHEYETVLCDKALVRRTHEQMCHDAPYHRQIVVMWLKKTIQLIDMISAANQNVATRNLHYHQISS